MLCLLGGSVYALSRLARPWSPPVIAVLGMVAGWYMIEPIYFPEYLEDFLQRDVSTAFGCVLIFIVTLSIATPVAVKAFVPRRRSTTDPTIAMSAEQLVRPIVMLWICLLVYGTFRMEGDILGALFPIEGRAGVSMWSRAAGEGAGATGFIVSFADYLYVLVLAAFGLLLFLARNWRTRWLLLFCIAISWPYAFMQGSRNITLFVVMPALVAYLLHGRAPIVAKVLVAVGAFFAIEFVMRAIIALRDAGFQDFSSVDLQGASHLGLNMVSELTYIVGFIEDGILNPSYGLGYVRELLNFIPRAIWPDKPLLGLDYALARGYGGQLSSDIGIFATLSAGVVGQGVQNFGLLLGPMVAGSLIALWIGLLTRLRIQGGTARNGLFLVGLGLTFNLGRDISLLVLFPFVFGYVGILLLEAYIRKTRPALNAENASPSVGNATVWRP